MPFANPHKNAAIGDNGQRFCVVAEGRGMRNIISNGASAVNALHVLPFHIRIRICNQVPKELLQHFFLSQNSRKTLHVPLRMLHS